MNSWKSRPLSACLPPLRMFIIGTGQRRGGASAPNASSARRLNSGIGAVRGRRPGDGQRDAEDRVGAEAALVGRAVQRRSSPGRSRPGRRDPGPRAAAPSACVTLRDRLQHAQAAVSGAVAVAQLQGLVDAGARPRRHRGAPDRTGVERHVRLDRGVAPRVQDLPGRDGDRSSTPAFLLRALARRCAQAVIGGRALEHLDAARPRSAGGVPSGVASTRARIRRSAISIVRMSPGRTVRGRRYRASVEGRRGPAWHRLLARARRRTSRLTCRNLSSRTPQRRQFLGRTVAKRPAALAHRLFQTRKAVAELGARRAQHLLSIKPQIARQVGDGEEQVPEFLGDAVGWLAGVTRARAPSAPRAPCRRPRARSRPREPGARRAALHLLRERKRRQRAREARRARRPAGVAAGRAPPAPRPAPSALIASQRVRTASGVSARASPNTWGWRRTSFSARPPTTSSIVNAPSSAGHLARGRRPAAAGRPVPPAAGPAAPGVDRLERLVRLLEQVRPQRRVRLLAVPRAPSRGAQAGHDRDEVLEPLPAAVQLSLPGRSCGAVVPGARSAVPRRAPRGIDAVVCARNSPRNATARTAPQRRRSRMPSEVHRAPLLGPNLARARARDAPRIGGRRSTPSRRARSPRSRGRGRRRGAGSPRRGALTGSGSGP